MVREENKKIAFVGYSNEKTKANVIVVNNKVLAAIAVVDFYEKTLLLDRRN